MSSLHRPPTPRASPPNRSRPRLLASSTSRLTAALALCLVALLVGRGGALAWQGVTLEQELAIRFAPVIILQHQDFPCDAEGEPYAPAPVDVVFADEAVVLRQGPQQDAVSSPVENADLFALPDHYATDFPGHPRTAGCDYESHFKAVMGEQRPVIYAYIASEEGQRGVALQYWFFYYFNDFNNKHEGDWEMIQVLFDADSVEEALGQEPVQVAFAQHSGGETADWDAPKLEREGTRPVVYASSGSHASYYGPGLWLGWGQDGSGLGCDVTDGVPVRIDPEVRLIPETIAGEDNPFAWVTFSGHWGERETWVYDGPTGPAFKPQWTAPVSWMEELRADSIRVNAAGVIGPAPSDIFCAAVENGSALLTLFTPYPLLVIGILTAGLGIVIWTLRQSWPTLRETWRVYWPHVRVFAGIGGIMAPAPLALSVLQYLLATSADFVAFTRLSEDSPELQGALGAVSFLTRGLLLVIVSPAVVQVVGDIVAGRRPGVRRAFREGFARIPDLVWTLARGGLIVLLLTISVIGIPWAANRSVRWMFGSQAAVLMGIRGKTALDDSATAVRGRWWQAAANGAVLAFVGAAPGVIVGLVLLILARFPVDAANSVASLVFAFSQPFAIAGVTLLYLRWRGQPVATATRQGGIVNWKSFAGSRKKHVGPKEIAPA
jgi:Vacuolar protein sorting-associated protein 62